MPRDRGAARFLASVGALISARAYLAISQFLVLPIVARHLSVSDFALMAMAMVVVVLASTLSDAGMGRSLIRAHDADEVEWSSVFWVITAGGVALAGITCALAPIAAWFFGEPRLSALLLALSLVPLMQAISAAPNADIEKRENYSGIARVQMVSTTLALGLALTLALLGAGVWALVAQQIALAATRLVGILFLSQFRPRFTFSIAGLRPHLVFARDTLGVSLLMEGRNQLSVLGISRFLGAVPLGYFAMSERFTRLPQFGVAGPMVSVVFVRMSKAQHAPERLAAIYLASMRMLALILIPSMAVIAVAGAPIFTLFLGAEWAPMTPVFALSIGGLVLEAVAIFSLQALFRVLARTDLLLRLVIETVLLRIALLAAALPFGLEAVAASITIWGLLAVPRGWQMAIRLVPLRLRDCVESLLPAAFAGALASLAWLGLATLPALAGAWSQAIAGVALAALAPAICGLIDRRKMRDAITIFRSDARPAPVTPPDPKPPHQLGEGAAGAPLLQPAQ